MHGALKIMRFVYQPEGPELYTLGDTHAEVVLGRIHGPLTMGQMVGSATTMGVGPPGADTLTQTCSNAPVGSRPPLPLVVPVLSVAANVSGQGGLVLQPPGGGVTTKFSTQEALLLAQSETVIVIG